MWLYHHFIKFYDPKYPKIGQSWSSWSTSRYLYLYEYIFLIEMLILYSYDHCDTSTMSGVFLDHIGGVYLVDRVVWFSYQFTVWNIRFYGPKYCTCIQKYIKVDHHVWSNILCIHTCTGTVLYTVQVESSTGCVDFHVVNYRYYTTVCTGKNILIIIINTYTIIWIGFQF